MAERERQVDWKVESGSAGVMIQSDPELEAWLADLLAAVYLSELSGKGETNE